MTDANLMDADCVHGVTWWECSECSQPLIPEFDPGRPFAELRDEGFLWLINTVVFHPRGYALALHFDAAMNATGWSLYGDGSEPWQMPDDPEIDTLFAKTKGLLG